MFLGCCVWVGCCCNGVCRLISCRLCYLLVVALANRARPPSCQKNAHLVAQERLAAPRQADHDDDQLGALHDAARAAGAAARAARRDDGAFVGGVLVAGAARLPRLLRPGLVVDRQVEVLLCCCVCFRFRSRAL
jgi:hypothetical protein